MSDAEPQYFTKDLIRWSETLAAIARTGMGFTQSLYEKERYEEVLKVAADIKVAADDALEIRREQDHFVQEWMESVGEGIPGYVTPKVAIGAIIGNSTRDFPGNRKIGVGGCQGNDILFKGGPAEVESLLSEGVQIYLII